MSVSGRHYPLEFRRFRKRQQCEGTGEEFVNHMKLSCQWVDWVFEREIRGDFAFARYFTNSEILNHIHSKQDRFGRPRAYVGELKFNRNVEWKGRLTRADKLAATIDTQERKPIRRARQQQGYLTATLHIPGVKHKVRIVILWDSKRDKQPCKFLVTNRGD